MTSLIVEDDTEEGAVDVNPVSIVVQEAELPELVHEVTHPGAGGANHFGEYFLTDLRDDHLRFPFFPEMGHEKEHPRETLLAGIEELVHYVFLHANASRQEIGLEQLREDRVLVECLDHGLFFNAQQERVFLS